MTEPIISAPDWRHRLVRPAAERVAQWLVRLHISANTLTVTGFLIVVGAAVLIAVQESFWAGIVMLIGSLLDGVDGAVARLTGRANRFGAMLDSVLDRLSEGVVLVALVYVTSADGRPGVAVLAGVTLLFSLMVSYARARAEGLGISCSEGYFTRVERVIVLALGLLTGYIIVALAAVAALSMLTFLQRLYTVWRKAG
ncbi:MAG: CDP-alcohol phosphatidyltransferase family protein [Dehalococcoidia bacterium]|nr:CDP-alcohol phosphatidyltransferase family protein [Dehalococcoidia bacterium]